MKGSDLLSGELRTVAAAATDDGRKGFECFGGEALGLVASAGAEVLFDRATTAGDFDWVKQEVGGIVRGELWGRKG